MRGFCIRWLAFLLLQVLIFVGLVWDPDYPREDGYLAATIDKHHHLRSTPSPRVILVGGSNLAFGFRSEWLQREVGKPVVNMGLVAGLGPGFLLNEVADVLQAGDVVILSFENAVLGGTDHPLHQRQLLEYRPASWWFCPRDQRVRMLLDHGLSLAGGIVRRSLNFPPRAPDAPSEFPYVRHGFNEYGDYVLHHTQAWSLTSNPTRAERLEPSGVPGLSPRLRQRLEAFALLCHARSVRLFFTFPPRPAPAWEAQRDALNRVAAELGSIPHLALLDAPEDHVYPLSLFADTADHLTEEGGDQRTRKVAATLEARLLQP
jgi:hypothetical protein